MTDLIRWKHIKKLFDQALPLTKAERELYLKASCGSDSELRAELDSLLSAFDVNTEFMETPALVEVADLLNADFWDPHLGRQIGRYQITRRLGEGGMGVVYEGKRIDGHFEQRVAIKLVKRGMDSDHMLRRFRNERQILAGLAHPNIAKLLDGGMTEDGLPYFVMEFIGGQLIDSYCRSQGFNTAKCVELVHQVCGAVGYAHTQHIIHRDIKPSNIIVDSQGIPKLLDFGIAKLMSAESGEVSQRTVTELRIITPDYASPEQVRGEPATERSDIYSLGVVLSELVTGQRFTAPLDPGSTPPKLPRDLQLILGRATHQDMNRRYASMAEFNADLERFLLGQSVAARPDSIFYRTVRTVRQHSKIAWALSLVVVAILAALASWLAQRAPSIASGARPSIAVIEFQNITGAPSAAWFSTALTEMLNAELSAGEKLRIIPGDSVARMQSDIGLQPAGSYSLSTMRRIAANIHPDYLIAGSYLATGDKTDMLVRVDLRLQDIRNAESLLTWTDTGTPAELPAMATRAGAKLRQILGVTVAPAPATKKATDVETTHLYSEGLQLIRSFDLLGARTRLEQAVAKDPADPMSHSALAIALGQLGYEDRAADEAKRALDLSSGLSKHERLEVEANYHNMRRDWAHAAATFQTLWTQFPDNLDYGLGLAAAQTKGGNVPAARQTIAQIRRNPLASLDPRIDLADALTADTVGESQQELELAERAAAKARQAGARMTLAECFYYEAWAKWLLGDLKGAEQRYSDAINIFSEVGNQRRVIDMESGLSAVLLDEGKTAESAQLLETALPIARKLGDRALEGVVNNNLARCWEETGQLKKALAAYEQSAAIDRELNDKPNLAIGLVNVGGVLNEQGEFASARRRTLEALEIARSVGRKSTIAIALSNLGEASHATGDLAQAAQFQAEALVRAREIGRKTSIASALRGQADILRSQAKWTEAEAKYQEASRAASDANAPGRLAEIRLAHAQLLTDEHQFESASRLARQALAEYQIEKSGEGLALAEAVLSQLAAFQHKAAEAAPLAAAARQHLAESENIATRVEVEKAQALATFARKEQASALRTLLALAVKVQAKGLQESAWDLKLLAAEIQSTEQSRRHAAEIKRNASAKGIFRIAQLKPRLNVEF